MQVRYIHAVIDQNARLQREPGHVLDAMGISLELATTAIRVSFGWRSRAEDVERFVTAWQSIYQRSRAAADAA